MFKHEHGIFDEDCMENPCTQNVTDSLTGDPSTVLHIMPVRTFVTPSSPLEGFPVRRHSSYSDRMQ
jgi:hypothetical protein